MSRTLRAISSALARRSAASRPRGAPRPRGEVRGERGAGQRRAEAACHRERVGAGLELSGDGGAARGAERRAGPRGEDDDGARVAGPLAEEPRRRAGLEPGRAATTHLGASGRFASASATCVQTSQ